MSETKLQRLLNEYNESHLDATNKLIHFVCVPAIMFSLIGMLMAIPMPWDPTPWYTTMSAIVIYGVLIYYARLSWTLFFAFIIVGLLLLLGNWQLFSYFGWNRTHLFLASLVIFIIAWIGQFVGHKIEGKKPSFLKDLQFLLIGPAWIIQFLIKKL